MLHLLLIRVHSYFSVTSFPLHPEQPLAVNVRVNYFLIGILIDANRRLHDYYQISSIKTKNRHTEMESKKTQQCES